MLRKNTPGAWFCSHFCSFKIGNFLARICAFMEINICINMHLQMSYILLSLSLSASAPTEAKTAVTKLSYMASILRLMWV